MTDRVSRSFIADETHSAVVPGSRVIRSSEVAHIGGRVATLVHAPSPSIELVTEDDVITAIDVTCSCGKKMRLWLSYEPPAQQQDMAKAS